MTRWHYFNRRHSPNYGEEEDDVFGEKIEGPEYVVEKNESIGKWKGRFVRSRDQNDVQVAEDFVEFLGGLQEKLNPYHGTVSVRPTLTKDGILYRANPLFHKAVWRDWAIVRWADEGDSPNELWGFFCLKGVDFGDDEVYHGGVMLESKTYAIVEHATYLTDKEIDDAAKAKKDLRSSMFRPILKEVGSFFHNYVARLKFYLAPVESIHGPIAVIPDPFHETNRYHAIRPRSMWAKDFEVYLQQPHESFNDFPSVREDDVEQGNDDSGSEDSS